MKLRGRSHWWFDPRLSYSFHACRIFPTNKKLLDTSLDPQSDMDSQLLARWARLHAVRSVLGLTAFLIFILLLARGGQ
jgi:hypothetical protein